MFKFGVVLVTVLINVHIPTSVICSDLKTVDVDNLMLLNVAVKGRLINKLTEAIEKAQTSRQVLAEDVKDCLVQASASHVLCRECVRSLCERRTLQCNGNITEVEIVMKKEEETPIPEVKIVEPDVKLAETVIEMSNTAKDDLLQEVPESLRNEGQYIVEEAQTESKLETLKRTLGEGFNKAMDTIPKLIPKVKDAFINMETQLSDPQTIDRLANGAAEQVAIAMQGKQEVEEKLNRNMDVLQQKLPRVLETVNNHFSNIMSSVKSFMRSTVQKVNQMQGNEDFGKIFKFPKSENDAKKWSTSIISLHIMRPDGKVTSWRKSNQMISPQVSLNQNQAPQSGHISQIPRRFQRGSNDVRCDDIAKNPQEACELYHFQCQSCANDTILLQHKCGKTALKKMVDIKLLDMKTAMYVTVYTKYLRHGLVVEKVKYDEDSYDSANKVYRSAFITAKIGKKIITYETSALPAFTDLTSSGGEIGEELWEIMNHEGEFEPGHFVKSFEDDLEGAYNLKQTARSGCVQSAVNSVVFTVLGVIFYFGFIVL
ncbi:uncharacterized protein LOC133188154 [Saccostrea echinata]|uniref:uncharacterized protein LOC133188154 n=1 Tax=Saccostrea echinata TaxID=191078 RepID=UPI002A8401A6|nr:uncharacterized protein LOC133188154 [Saccostrea echinata]